MIAARQIFLGRGGAKLPYDAEVEYLESTGTQYIDTGYHAKTNSIFKCIIKPISRIINGMSFWGATKGDGNAGNGDQIILCDKFGNTGKLVFLATSTSPTNTFSFSYGDVLTITANVNTSSLSCNGTTVANTQTALVSPAQYPIFIGGTNLAGSLFRGSNARYYSWSVEENGVLVRDFMPVRFTNEQGVSEGAMYDRVNPTVGMNHDGTPRDDGLYLNRGTGVFGYGNDN